MKPPALHPTPLWRNVVEAQLRSVGLAVRPALTVAGASTVITTLLMGFGALRRGGGFDVVPDMALLVTLFAPLFSVAVWRGEYDFRRSYLASMPVDPARHTLIKIASGWVSLMAVAAAFLLWILALALLTGGQIGVDETLVVAGDLPPSARWQGLLPEDADALVRRWTTPSWRWSVFFTAPTIAYLFGSAVVLAGSRTRWWLAAFAVVCFFISIVDDEIIHVGGIAERLEMALVIVMMGRYGLAALFGTAVTDTLATTTGEEIQVWNNLPTLEAWLVATLLWTALAAAGVAAVVWRGRKG